MLSPKLWLVPPLALCCVSCGKDVVVQRVPVPERLLSCKAEPPPPAEDTDKADHIDQFTPQWWMQPHCQPYKLVSDPGA